MNSLQKTQPSRVPALLNPHLHRSESLTSSRNRKLNIPLGVGRADESRFELELRHQPGRALELAKQNWEVQRTPIDARTYLAAALAAKDADAAKLVAGWVATTGLEDRGLNGMLAKATL